jgi:hypothetical protein
MVIDTGVIDLICPECGSYQPNKVKYCGICGVPLISEEPDSSFFLDVDEEERELALPRHRGVLFYFALFTTIFLVLALVSGLTLLVMHALRSERESPPSTEEIVEESTLHYTNEELGFSFVYPILWDLAETDSPSSLPFTMVLKLSSEKRVKIAAERLSPDIMLGGMEDIELYIEELVNRDLGPAVLMKSGDQSSAQEGKLPVTLLTLSGYPAYTVQLETTSEGRSYTSLYYFIVADELLFMLKGSAPSESWEETLSDFMVMVGTFRIEKPENNSTEPTGSNPTPAGGG